MRMRTVRYDWFLALAGVGLPVVGTAIEAMSRFGSVAPPALWQAHLAQPLLWIMDTTPFVLGGLGRVIVRQHEDLVRQSAELVRRSQDVVRVEQARREGLESTAKELAGAAQALLGSVAEFTAMTTAAAAGVRETTEAMGDLSQSAASAALTAETVIGLAVRSERLLAASDTAQPPGDPDQTARGLAEALDRSVKAAKEIARVAQRQEQAIEHVHHAMSGISHATAETVASTRAVEREARALSDLAESLQAAVKG
jgi:methyl-accepting chemotaxis protein